MPSSIPASFWESQQPVPAPLPSVQGDKTYDILIIGGGFTGLSTARELLKDNPALKVAVLEAKHIGYGASGRNGGFNMTLFGLEPEITLLRWGKQKATEAQAYMERAVSYVHDLVEEYDIKSDYEHGGMLRVAYSDPQKKRLEKSMALFEKLGIGQNYRLMERAEVQASVHSPRFQAGVYEANSGVLNPYKHVRELARIALGLGADIFETSPVEQIERHGSKITLHTNGGKLHCEKLVIAVNAWSGQIRGLPRIRRRQTPVWTAQVVTAPLSAQQWDEVGWAERQSLEDNRQMIHYFRRTACGRFTMGGGNIALPKPGSLGEMDTPAIWKNLESHLKWLFPSLRDIAIDYRWGGPVSVNMDMTPEIGFIGDKRIIYANGCIGHGVSLTQLNGRTIADLLLDKQTELSDIWFVNRKAIGWPPGLIGKASIQMIAGGLKLWDRIEERKLDKG